MVLFSSPLSLSISYPFHLLLFSKFFSRVPEQEQNVSIRGKSRATLGSAQSDQCGKYFSRHVHPFNSDDDIRDNKFKEQGTKSSVVQSWNKFQYEQYCVV